MSLPAVQSKTLTFEDVARLNPDEDPGELVDGKWVPVSRNTIHHGKITAKITYLLVRYALENDGWTVVNGDAGMKLTRKPDTLKGADIAVIRSEREPTGRGAKGWLEGGADLAVEVVGDSENAALVIEKAFTYLPVGTKMAWVVEPHLKRVYVVTPPNQIQILRETDVLDGADVLPGFSCGVAELFRLKL